MAFYYIRNNSGGANTFVGTATVDGGRETVQRTGAWDTDVSKSYGSLLELTTESSLATGDTVFLGDDHNKNYTVSTVLNLNTAVNDAVTTYSSVDILSQDQYKKGAAEAMTSGASFTILRQQRGTKASFSGISFTNSGSDRTYLDSDRGVFTFFDCVLSSSRFVQFCTSRYTFLHCDLPVERFYNNSGLVYIEGGIYTTTSTTMFSGSFDIHVTDCDMSGSVSGADLMSDINNAAIYRFTRCKMPPNYDVRPGTSATGRVELISCDTTGGGYYNQSIYESSSGEVNTNTLVYLNYAYDGTNKASTLYESNSYVTQGSPQREKLCEIPAQDLAAGDTTYRVNLLLDVATAASLTDNTLWIELAHNDNTDLSLGKLVSSRNADILSAGTTLTASAETWLGTLPASSQAYQVDVTLSAASLPNVTNGNVTVYVNLALPNVDVYVCPAVQIEQV